MFNTPVGDLWTTMEEFLEIRCGDWEEHVHFLFLTFYETTQWQFSMDFSFTHRLSIFL